MLYKLKPILSVLIFCFLIDNVNAQDFTKTVDLSIGSSITNTQFKFKAEYLHKPQQSIYGRIGLRNRTIADESIGLDTISFSLDPTNVVVINRYSFRDGNDLLLNVGYRLYSSNYLTTNRRSHSHFYTDVGASFHLRLYEKSILPDNLTRYGIILGGGYKLFLDDHFNIDLSFNTESRFGKGTNNNFIDINGNIELGIGFTIGTRQKMSLSTVDFQN